MRYTATLLVFSLLSACGSDSPPPNEVEQALVSRLSGDRTGACVVAARVAAGEVTRAGYCADPSRAVDADTIFEIGSITKTMTGFPAAELVDEGLLDLDAPLADYLPEDAVVPSFAGAPILLRHVLTHRAGLPALPPDVEVDLDDPYAALDVATLLTALARVELTAAPGSEYAYSNFGYLLLSYVLSEVGGRPFEELLAERLFGPLAMEHATVLGDAIGGHASSGAAVPAWTWPSGLGGPGGVRASLEDLVRYAQAGLGEGDSDVVAGMAQAMTPLVSDDAGQTGYAWVVREQDGRAVALHDGATAGYSSFLIVDPEQARAVVVLADTNLVNLGGVADIALHLYAPDEIPVMAPHLEVAAPGELLAQLAGDYTLFGLALTLADDGGELVATGALVEELGGASEARFGYDSYGVFFSRDLDYVLAPVELDDGTLSFDLLLGGVPTRVERTR